MTTQTETPLVGYGRPPVETRFQPGRSGNPKGRPKGSKNYDTILRKLLEEKPPAERRGVRRASRPERIVESQINRAIAGDIGALKWAIELMRECDTVPEPGYARPSENLPGFGSMRADTAFLLARLHR